jgi:predicted ester cyclase
MADAREVAREHDEAYNAKDAGRRKAIESPDIEVVMPGGMRLRGPDQVMEVVKVFWEALPDGKIVTDNQYVAGDIVVAEGAVRGTHTGPFRAPTGEIPPSGNEVTLRFATVKQIKDGKLVSERLYFDQLEFLQQIGAMPSQ